MVWKSAKCAENTQQKQTESEFGGLTYWLKVSLPQGEWRVVPSADCVVRLQMWITLVSHKEKTRTEHEKKKSDGQNDGQNELKMIDCFHASFLSFQQFDHANSENTALALIDLEIDDVSPPCFQQQRLMGKTPTDGGMKRWCRNGLRSWRLKWWCRCHDAAVMPHRFGYERLKFNKRIWTKFILLISSFEQVTFSIWSSVLLSFFCFTAYVSHIFLDIFLWISHTFLAPFRSTRSCVKSSEVSPCLSKANSFSQVAGWKLLRSSMGGAHLFKPEFCKQFVSWFMSVFLFFETFDLVWYDNPWDLFPRPFDLFVRTPSEIVLQLEASFPSPLFPSPLFLSRLRMSHGSMGLMCRGEGKWHHWRSQGRKIQKNSINFLSFFFCFFQFCFWFQFFCLTTSSQKCLIFCCQREARLASLEGTPVERQRLILQPSVF